MSLAIKRRAALAATALLALFACAYETAVRWPGQPAATVPATMAARRNRAVVDTLVASPPPSSEIAAVDTIPAVAEEKPLREMSADTAIRFAAYDPLAGDTLAHPHTYRRYVGTLNGQAIVVHLSVQANVQVKSYQEYEAGSWYYRYARQPAEHQLLFRHQRGGQLVVAEEISDHTAADTARMEWQFGWPLGRTERGRRRAVYGMKQQVMQLREDYTQAVPYELLRLSAHRNGRSSCSNPYYSTNFLRVLSTDSLRLADWQAPPPAARRDSLRHWLLSESCQQVSQTITVTLNDYNLLSYNVWKEGYYYGAHPEHDQVGFIVDLGTGREWLVEELLRAGTERALLKLLARHLRHDYPEMNEDDNWHWKTVPPYPSSFTLTPTGLCAGYNDYALAAYAASYANTTTIPYRELRPLVRPGTPLARMLKARGRGSQSVLGSI